MPDKKNVAPRRPVEKTMPSMIGFRIRLGMFMAKHRKKSRMSMEDVARMVGVSRTTIFNIEHATLASPIEVVVACAKSMGPEAQNDLSKMILKFTPHRAAIRPKLRSTRLF